MIHFKSTIPSINAHLRIIEWLQNYICEPKGFFTLSLFLDAGMPENNAALINLKETANKTLVRHKLSDKKEDSAVAVPQKGTAGSSHMLDHPRKPALMKTSPQK